MEFYFLKLLPIIVASILFLIGFIGVFIPIIPAAILVWSSILIHKLWAGEFSVSWNFFWFVTGLTLFVQLVDFLCTYWGAKRFGATWKGVLGAFLGMIAGLFIPFPGIILGPILGAILAELIGGNSLKKATKAGLGTALGGFFAFIIRLAVVCFMIVSFYLKLFP